MDFTTLYPFEHGYLAPEQPTNAWAIVFCGKKILIKSSGGTYRIPLLEELTALGGEPLNRQYIGQYAGNDCFCMQYDSKEALPVLPEGLSIVELKEITALTGDPGLFILAGAANHILHWNRTTRYCGCCGHENIDKQDERAKVCPNCGAVVYPRISPATITAVLRGDKILLAHNSNFQAKLHSLIAGFVEPGETLEHCVAREIHEEVGISVSNIRYFGSQPWPFPDSLMTAFIADYAGGEITVDNREILSASWFDADSLPEIPTGDSIAGKIIRWYRDEYSKK